MARMDRAEPDLVEAVDGGGHGVGRPEVGDGPFSVGFFPEDVEGFGES